MLRKGIVMGLILVVVAATGVALAAVKNVSSGEIEKNVDASHVVTKTLNVKKQGKIKDVNVGVALQTNQNSDYAMLLDPPKGPMVHLASGVGGSGSGFGTTCATAATFDDENGDDIEDTEGIDTNLGSDTLNGKQMKGKWTLIAMSTEDTGGADLQCFKLELKS
jgi:subtilisin-like proprotein convertase family protein